MLKLTKWESKNTICQGQQKEADYEESEWIARLHHQE